MIKIEVQKLNNIVRGMSSSLSELEDKLTKEGKKDGKKKANSKGNGKGYKPSDTADGSSYGNSK